MAQSPNLIQAIRNSNLSQDDQLAIIIELLRAELRSSPQARKLILEYGQRRGWINQSPEPKE